MLLNALYRSRVLGFLFIAFLFVIPAKATHNLSAELTYHTDTTNTSPLRYFFKLVLYEERTLTSTGMLTARLSFSDGTIQEVQRASRTLLNSNARIYRDVYYFQHQFPREGNFIVSFIEINRAIDYVNITKSENVALFIQSIVKVDVETVGNRSLVFLAPFIPTGIVGQSYRHNLTAFDPDGDSLAYKLVPGMQRLNQYIPSYQFPTGATINNKTGEFIWPAPDRTGRFGVTIEIREYRQGQLVGTVMREIALVILPTGLKPVLEIRNRDQVPVNARNQVFINSDTPVKIRVAATNASNLVAYSELLRHANVITSQITADSPREIELTITPNSALRRSLPYIITFRGTSPTTDPEIYHQQDLTVAIYFRSERTTDQQDTTEPGEIPVITGDASPDSDEMVFKIFPNPVQGWFKIVKNDNKPVTLRVYNASSQLVLNKKFNQAQTIIQRQEQLRPGIYFYIILSEAGQLQNSGKLLFL